MAKERRDNKNRILWKGEYQKPDGRYMYRYVGVDGQARFVYSWTLTKADRTPKGKQQGKCLRDIEKEIARDLQDEINTFLSNKKTLNDYFDTYIEQKIGIERVTRSNYKKFYNAHIRDSIGRRAISTIKYSDIKSFYLKLISESQLSIGTIENINIVISPVFKMAVRDNSIRKNPTQGIIGEIKKEFGYVSTKKRALTTQEQEKFINFVQNSKRYNEYLPLFTFMLGTGCRISEASALTWEDCDFTNNVIHITKSLVYCTDDNTGKPIVYISPPKTVSGIRDIPMLEDVKIALQKEKVHQMRYGFNLDEISGYTGFVFMNTQKHVLIGKHLNPLLSRLVKQHNREEEELAKKENREPIFLPNITTHIFRHTFCTRLCENESNLKIIQDVMGHANINVTMNVYADATLEKKKESFEELNGKFMIG